MRIKRSTAARSKKPRRRSWFVGFFALFLSSLVVGVLCGLMAGSSMPATRRDSRMSVDVPKQGETVEMAASALRETTEASFRPREIEQDKGVQRQQAEVHSRNSAKRKNWPPVYLLRCSEEGVQDFGKEAIDIVVPLNSSSVADIVTLDSGKIGHEDVKVEDVGKYVTILDPSVRPATLSPSLDFLLDSFAPDFKPHQSIGVCADVIENTEDEALLLGCRPCQSALKLNPDGIKMVESASSNVSLDSATFVHLMEEHNAFLLFQTRAAVESGAARPEKVMFLDREVEAPSAFAERNRAGLDDLLHYVRHHTSGTILLSVINRNFILFARSWMCNVDLLRMRPEGIVWVTTDQESYDAMRKLDGVATFLLHGMSGAENEDRGSTFGTPGYWDLMLSRAKLVRELLDRGISVLLFDSDQVWLQDPLPQVVASQQESNADVIGTLVTGEEVGGNFVYLRATNRTRVMYRGLCDMFEEDYLRWGMDKKDSSFSRRIRNDQTILSSFVHRNEKWKAVYQCVFRVLDQELYLDGRWYKGVYRKNTRTHLPVLVNNNYIEGNDEKIKRARRFGHWFLAEDNITCLLPEPIKGRVRNVP